MASYSDEEALDALLDADQPQHVRSHLRSMRSVSLSIILASSVLAAVALWVSKGGAQGAQEPRLALPVYRFEEKSAVGDAAAGPQEAYVRNDRRKRMIVEQDLQTLLHIHVSKRQAHFHYQTSRTDAESCLRQAERLFDEVAEESGMELELRDEEFMAFRKRFAAGMQGRCKDIISERIWLHSAGEELEQQKPMVTAATVVALNNAGLGFKAKLHDWLVHESVATFSSRLGLLPTPKNQKSVLKRPRTRQAEHLPRAFRAELKWPQCRDAILRIHNQGHCGSCWAFGGLASIDARMCIASNGSWDATADILSRLQVTSCAPDNYWEGHDGCQGGFPHWPMEMMGRTGVVSSSCLPYYISGEGSEHFQHQDAAPPCESHCQGGYSLALAHDAFSSAGVANYDWITHVHGDPDKVATMRNAIYQEGPVAFAFCANHAFMSYSSGVFSVCTGHDQANHAVYAFGWGLDAQEDGGAAVEYFEASNSWGTNWGADGHFRIHPRCVTDVTIPGPIQSNSINHNVGTVDPDVPKDPDNEYWPWAAPDECPYTDGCITDREGSGNYTNNELCVSKKLNGKRIRVVEFDLEWGYDILKVNGRSFSGSAGHGLDASLDGLRVDDTGITFMSDFSLSKAGFKLCEE